VVLAGLTLAAFVLRFYRLGDMPLFGDEAYYLLWAGRLAPAYLDHPAGMAFLLKASTLLGGHTELGVRWLSALLSVACVPLAYAVGWRYVSVWGGMIAAVAVALGPVYIITGRVAYPDSTQGFLLLVNLLALAPLIMSDPAPGGPPDHPLVPGRQQRPASVLTWAWFGLTLALLLNVKLSSGFYAAALVVYFLIWRRDHLRDPGLWVAALIAGIGLTPFVWWNATHNWATIRWAIYHGQGFGLVRQSLFASLRHAAVYLSPPVVLLILATAAIPALSVRRHLAAARRSERPPETHEDSRPASGNRGGPILLVLVAAFLILPVVLSAADSPRNLGLGLLVVWPLAGMQIVLPGGHQRSVTAIRATRLAELLLCASIALYGLGTAAALLGPTRLPHHSSTNAIRWDAAAWPQFASWFRPPASSTVFAVDYSVAGQVSHYTGRPVYSSEGQYRLWGIPEFENLTVLGLDSLPTELVTARLREDFASVSGPEPWRYDQEELSKTVYIWQATGRRSPVDSLLDDLDYLNLARQAGLRLH
jgi:4-amino-4-deoxy-L-arabinose transferase-like glycosyltransferase